MFCGGFFVGDSRRSSPLISVLSDSAETCTLLFLFNESWLANNTCRELLRSGLCEHLELLARRPCYNYASNNVLNVTTIIYIKVGTEGPSRQGACQRHNVFGLQSLVICIQLSRSPPILFILRQYVRKLRHPRPPKGRK